MPNNITLCYGAAVPVLGDNTMCRQPQEWGQSPRWCSCVPLTYSLVTQPAVLGFHHWNCFHLALMTSWSQPGCQALGTAPSSLASWSVLLQGRSPLSLWWFWSKQSSAARLPTVLQLAGLQHFPFCAFSPNTEALILCASKDARNERLPSEGQSYALYASNCI